MALVLKKLKPFNTYNFFYFIFKASSRPQELRVASEFLVASQFCVYSCTSQTLPSINCLMS